MLYIILAIFFVLPILFFSLNTDTNRIKNIKNLVKENNELKRTIFRVKNENRKLNDKLNPKNLAIEILSDATYWMRRAFQYAKENKKLKIENDKLKREIENSKRYKA